jgi:hypothetical protein
MSAIRRMLKTCTGQDSVVPKLHHNWVTVGSLTYRGFPKGKHGARKDPEIEIGHVRHMIRFLHINEDCAKKQLPMLTY